MQLKKPFIRSLCIVGVGSTVFLALFALSKLDFASRALNTSVSSAAESGIPVRLVIPSINVDAVVEQVGLTAQGAMDVPKSPSRVAWFTLGPRPGEEGSAVIAGHEGWKDSIPAAFDNLFKLQKGDRIYVTDEKGASKVFIVRMLRVYDQYQDVPGIFSSTDGKDHLNLITCEGSWNAATKSYANRLVVFTDEE